MNVPSIEVKFARLGRSAETKADETLLDVARRVGAPIGNSCGGTGVCARCTVRVLAGKENLSPPTSIESRVARERGLASDERLACQAVVNGPCEITTSYW